MNKTQQRQAAKGKAFNRLLKIYHPKANWQAPEFPRDLSYREKRDEEVEVIFMDYFNELNKINKNE